MAKMHNIEPYYNWNYLYDASKDKYSPFYERQYSEFYFTDKIYDHVIHPQWDNFGSQTLYMKILFTDYENGFTIIELIGEWNDCIENDIMTLIREVFEFLQGQGIKYFVLIGENLLNYFASDEEYYQEWQDLNEEGWVCLVNFREHVLDEMSANHIDHYWIWGGILNNLPWRKLKPQSMFSTIQSILKTRLG